MNRRARSLSLSAHSVAFNPAYHPLTHCSYADRLYVLIRIDGTGRVAHPLCGETEQ